MGTASSTIQTLIRRAASSYTVGPAITDARTVCEQLASERIATVVCYWNNDFDSSLFVADSYLRLLDVIRKLPNSYLSVKASAIGFDIELLKKILDKAQCLNATVHFDAMTPDSVDRTFTLIDQARRIYPKLGCTLPGRWRRSVHDIDRAIDFGLRVRVVKGEWCGLNGDETDAYEGFIKVVERLAHQGARHVAVATHDAKLAVRTLDCLKKARTPCELELLYGLPQSAMLKIARRHAVTPRIYIPYGYAGLPYRLKDAARKPRILAWFVRDLIRGSAAA
jgi:proline dehydrogenase